MMSSLNQPVKVVNPYLENYNLEGTVVDVEGDEVHVRFDDSNYSITLIYSKADLIPVQHVRVVNRHANYFDIVGTVIYKEENTVYVQFTPKAIAKYNSADVEIVC